MIFLRRWRAPSARIVRLGLSEAEIVADLHATGFARGWSAHEVEGLAASPGVVALGARLGSAMLGMVMLRVAADEAEILSIAVAPDWRGCGIAGRLLGHALDRAAGLGARRIFLEVEAENQPALALYRRAGFVEVGRRRAYYAAEGGGDALVLSLDISGRPVFFPPPPDAVEIGPEPR